MDELLSLLEELVINKIRIEKMQNEVIDSQHKRIVGNEIQIVSMIQEVIMDIQTSTMKSIYIKLKDYLANNSNLFDFIGDNSKFDSSNEEQLYEILKSCIDYILNSLQSGDEKKVKISASNDSTNLIIIISGFNKIVNQKKLAQKLSNDYISLTYLSEDELKKWIEEPDLKDSRDSLKEVYGMSKSSNISVEIGSEDDINGEIHITIPLSSSIIKAQLVQLDNQIYAIPMDYVEKVISLNSVEKRISCNKEFIMYMDYIIPVISVYDKLEINNSNEVSSYVVLKHKEKMIALPVHSLLEQTDVVIKPKPQVINEIKEFKGTSILGNGNVTIVFDIPYLVDNAS